jgi:hypothetical protein
MAPDTDSPTNEPRPEGGDLALRWSGQISLTRRILAVNIIALLLLAGGFFYLDSYRSRIVDSRVAQAAREARLIGEALAMVAARWDRATRCCSIPTNRRGIRWWRAGSTPGSTSSSAPRARRSIASVAMAGNGPTCGGRARG